jgi:hypothetical protein
MHRSFAAASSEELHGEEAARLNAAGSSDIRSLASPENPLPRAIPHTRQMDARSRLRSELRGIALDLVGLYQVEEMPRECATWVRTTIEAAVAEVCDPTVAALTRRLSAELLVAPADVARRIDMARRRHEAGFA